MVLDSLTVLPLVEKGTDLVDPCSTAVAVHPALFNFLIILLLLEFTFLYLLAVKLHALLLAVCVTAMAPVALHICFVLCHVIYLRAPFHPTHYIVSLIT